MNAYDRRAPDRWSILGVLVASDRWATAAVNRHDALALLRRIHHASLTGALHLAVEAAWMRGHGAHEITVAAGIAPDVLREHLAAICGAHAGVQPSTSRPPTPGGSLEKPARLL